MRRFRGHFYNWYDLTDLAVLEPAYISTVDSGNLAGHLIALRQACLEIRDAALADAGSGARCDTGLAIASERLSASHSVADRIRRRSRRAGAWRQPSARSARGGLGARGSPGSPAVDQPTRSSRWRHLRASARRGLRLPRCEWVGLVHPPDRASTAAVDPRPPAATELGAPARGDRRAGVRLRDGDGLPVPVRREPEAVRDRLPAGSHALDASYYDLLASEARLASFVAVAKDDVPVEHWFRLGRTLTHAAGETALVSWSGSMFEYLMPALVMQSFPFTLLDQTYSGAVRRHIAYGAERGVPWGVSESAYNLRDRHLTYQYRAFGVPDLALKRGLGRDLVVAPYASALAVMVEPAAGARQSRDARASTARSARTASATRSTTPARSPGQTLRDRAAPTWRITSG